MGLLYDDEHIAQDSDSNTNIVSSDVPVKQSEFMFVIRPGRAKRTRRRATSHSLPLYLSFSALSNDTDIARLISLSTADPLSPTIQHREASENFPEPMSTGTPQSLPPTSALGSPLYILDNFEWTVIDASSPTRISTPASEPETWILLSDDP